jgi:hypothetical protein
MHVVPRFEMVEAFYGHMAVGGVVSHEASRRAPADERRARLTVVRDGIWIGVPCLFIDDERCTADGVAWGSRGERLVLGKDEEIHFITYSYQQPAFPSRSPHR